MDYLSNCKKMFSFGSELYKRMSIHCVKSLMTKYSTVLSLLGVHDAIVNFYSSKSRVVILFCKVKILNIVSTRLKRVTLVVYV